MSAMQGRLSGEQRMKLGRTPGVLDLQLGEDGRAKSKKPNARWRRLELRLMRYTGRSVSLSWSAPRAAMAAVPAGETFPHQHITDALSPFTLTTRSKRP